MRVAIDPGQTTGFAWRAPDDSLRQVQVPGSEITTILNGLHATYGITEVVAENFRSRPGPAVNLSASEALGAIQLWCEERGIRMVRQEPSAAKKVFDNDRLRECGGWKRGQNHARDATRHLFLREERCGREFPRTRN